MNTIITYKIVYEDGGMIVDLDFRNRQAATSYALVNNITNYELYEVKTLGEMTKL